MRRYERWVRLVTGLILACYVVPHFLNHSLGVVSIDAMDRLRALLAAWWRSAPGTVILYGSLLTHFAEDSRPHVVAAGRRGFRRLGAAGDQLCTLLHALADVVAHALELGLRAERPELRCFRERITDGETLRHLGGELRRFLILRRRHEHAR